MKRYYIDKSLKVHNYTYDTDNRISKAKCKICHSRMNFIFGNRLGKHIKLGFICFTCNSIFISNTYTPFRCKISLLSNKRMRDD